MDFKRIFMVLFLGLVPSVNDQVSDVMNGVNFLTPYTVNIDDSDPIPAHCFKVDNVTLSCTDRVWGILTISFTQMPGVVYALIVIITSNFKTIWWCFIFILIFIPFPLFV